MGLSDHPGPVRIAQLGDGVTVVTAIQYDELSRFVPTTQHDELPEVFKAIVMNNLTGDGQERDGLRLVVLRNTHHPLKGETAEHMLSVVLDFGAWRDMRFDRSDDMPCSVSTGHELIRHGFIMLDRSTLPAGHTEHGMPYGPRVAGWERFLGREAWFTFVRRWDDEDTCQHGTTCAGGES